MRRPGRAFYAAAAIMAAAAVGAVWLLSTAAGRPAVSGIASSGTERSAASATGVRVETVRVTREDLQRTTEPGPAELNPFEQTEIYANVSGFVKKVGVEIGDRLKKGDLIAEIEVPDLAKELERKRWIVEQAGAGVEQARAALEEVQAEEKVAEAHLALARAGALKAEADFRFRQKEHQRIQALADQSSIDRAVVEEKQFQLESAEAARNEAAAGIQAMEAALLSSRAKLTRARADLKSAESGVGVAQADADKAAAVVEYSILRAPYNCVVTQRNIHTGAFVDARADRRPLFQVARTDLLRVVLDIPEKDAPFLGAGRSVQVDLDAIPGTHFHWKITRFAPVLGPGKKVRAEIQVENPEGKFFPGMYGHASVVLEERPGSLTLPISCLGRDAGGSFVFCVQDGRAKRVPVTIGLTDARKAEVTAGLTGSEVVVSSGKDLLKDGQEVVVAEAGLAGKKNSTPPGIPRTGSVPSPGGGER